MERRCGGSWWQDLGTSIFIFIFLFDDMSRLRWVAVDDQTLVPQTRSILFILYFNKYNFFFYRVVPNKIVVIFKFEWCRIVLLFFVDWKRCWNEYDKHTANMKCYFFEFQSVLYFGRMERIRGGVYLSQRTSPLYDSIEIACFVEWMMWIQSNGFRSSTVQYLM